MHSSPWTHQRPGKLIKSAVWGIFNCWLLCDVSSLLHHVSCEAKMLSIRQKGSRYRGKKGKGRERTESSVEVSFLSPCLSLPLSVSCYRNSSAVPLFLSLRTMCSVEEFGRSFCKLVSTAMAAQSLNKAVLARTGPELETTAPDAGCF